VLIYGLNPVLEALRAGRVARLRVAGRDDRRMAELLEQARQAGVPVEEVPREVLTHASGRGVHQGVVAELRQVRDWSVQELVEEADGPPLLVVLDGIEDPHNVGAILRTCDAVGVHGVVRQTRRAARLEGAAAKASAGAIAHVRIADVVNVARAIEELKEAGVWSVGLAADAERSYDAIDLTAPTALVVGAEGTGLRRLVRERCDWLAVIPMRGHVGSLNVSVATGVVLFEALRQRRAKPIEAGAGGRGLRRGT
jgi:23S rRNA (guanosine2251-2'-O)-methyltransferase